GQICSCIITHYKLARLIKHEFIAGAAGIKPSKVKVATQFNDEIFTIIPVDAAEKDIHIFGIKSNEVIDYGQICFDCFYTKIKTEKLGNSLIYNLDKKVYILNLNDKKISIIDEFDFLVEDISVKNDKIFIFNNTGFVTQVYLNDGKPKMTKLLRQFSSPRIPSNLKNYGPYKEGFVIITMDGSNIVLNYLDASGAKELGRLLINETWPIAFGPVPNRGGIFFIEQNGGIFQWAENTKKITAMGMLKYDFSNGYVVTENGILENINYKGAWIAAGYPVEYMKVTDQSSSYSGNPFSQYIKDQNLIINLSIGVDPRMFKVEFDTKKAIPFPNFLRAYVSDFVGKNEEIVFISGVTNGFSPTIYHTDLNFNYISQPIVLENNGISSTTVVPLGLIGNTLYLISNLNPSTGGELYSIELNMISAVDKKNLTTYSFEIFGDNMRVTSQQDFEQVNATFFTIDGKKLESRKMESNTWFQKLTYEGVAIVHLYKSNGTPILSKIIML
ncbi:MAG TPA: hypothetical protein PKD18_23045, partial [Saprospiraceae bacterium]|nr:hypothetical protein [Saprospiraceae bacterium]